jgi:UDP-N-acetylglucosamine--N-acetylmuramyl-(pentapeptide) pyrophosphoryl-undecaprenol N-acetylglucosamine transferase
VVLGLGGYVTFPGGMMAALRGIPLVLHEQNSVAGLANRVLAKVADRVLAGFPKRSPARSGPATPCAPTSPPCPTRLLASPAGRAAEHPGGGRQPRRAGTERSGTPGTGAHSRKTSGRA